MLCNICKENVATVHLTEIVEGNIKKADLCETCSKAKGVDDPTAFSLADLLLGLGASQELEQSARGGDNRCPRCGFTHSDFKKTGRLGCSYCYTAFADGLDSMLKTMHRGTRHIGKVPRSFRKTKDLKDRIDDLQTKLESAIKTENFEEAAQLRDEIKKTRADFGDVAAT